MMANDPKPTTMKNNRGRRRRHSIVSGTSALRSSFSYHCILLSFLFLSKFHSEAFSPRTTSTITRTITSTSRPLSAPPSQPRHRKRLRHETRSNSRSNSNSNSKSNTALGFFSLGNKKDVNYNEGEPDLPLSRYVDLSANYTLAYTPEDYIDLRNDQRLVCVGDVHGDLGALKRFLVASEVYDPDTDSWCGGDTVVVQCGDVLDRGFEELACYQLLARLSHQAYAHGGRLVLLVGNHEVLNAMGLFQYACSDQEHEQYIGTAVDAAIGGTQNKWRVQYVNNQPSRWASYEPGGLLAYSLMRNMKVAIRVGRTVVVHAGLKPEHLKDHGGIEGMNRAYRDWITLGEELGPDGSVAKQLASAGPLKYNHHGQYPSKSRVSPEEQPWIDAQKRQAFYMNSVPKFLGSTPQDPGPTWMRDYSSPHDMPPNDPTGDLEKMLDETLLLLDVDRMVVGHTIQRRINAAFSGKAWRIDIGASKGCVGGTPEVLEILGNREGPESVSILTEAGASGNVAKIPGPERTIDVYAAAALNVL